MVKKCSYPGCNRKVLSVLIDCNKCLNLFCGTHRLPEAHDCQYLREIKTEAFEVNRVVLEANKVENKQI